MKLTFIGVGTPFSSSAFYHSNMLLTAPSGKHLLIDCGGDARFALAEQGIGPCDIDAVYISHLHADHIGGLEWLALSTYFNPQCKRPRLFAASCHLRDLWQHSLRGGLERLRGRSLCLDDYFDCVPLAADGRFDWEGTRLTLVAMPHVQGDGKRHDSFGLLLEGAANSATAFISTDAVFQPETILALAARAELIFHDCETAPVASTVHARYDELRTLPAEIRRRMWLYHYQDCDRADAERDGFAGFVSKGQAFGLGPAGLD